jgi:ATP/maltotriose-dependent transcriptional regulator MalT
MRRLISEYDNLRAVLAWSRDGRIGAEIGLRLIGALDWFWVLSGVASEAREWARVLLDSPAAAARTRARARALLTAARIATVQDDTLAARMLAHESASIFRALGDDQGTGRALAAQAVVELDGNRDAARMHLDESVALARQAGDEWGLAFAFNHLSSLAQDDGDDKAARRFRDESASLARSIGDRITLGIALVGRAYLARQDADYAEAERLFREALSISSELGPSWRVGTRAIAGLAGIACVAGDYQRSAHLLGAVAAMWEASGRRDASRWRKNVDVDTATVLAALGDEQFTARWAEGQAMQPDEAVACALAESKPVSFGPRAASGF